MEGDHGHDSDPLQELAAELRRLKEASGLSFTKLQAKIPYSRSALQRYLSGALAPPRDAVAAIGAVCGGDLAKLSAMRDRVDEARVGVDADGSVLVVAAGGPGDADGLGGLSGPGSPGGPDSVADTLEGGGAVQRDPGAQRRLRIRALRAWGGLAVVIGLMFTVQHAMDGSSGSRYSENGVGQGPDASDDSGDQMPTAAASSGASAPAAPGASGSPSGPASGPYPTSGTGPGGVPPRGSASPSGSPSGSGGLWSGPSASGTDQPSPPIQPSQSPPASGPRTGPPTGPSTSAPRPPASSAPPAAGVPASFPDASTTGVPKGTQLTQSGPVVVTTDNATIQNLEVHGSITVYANNVTIKNVRVLTGSGDYWGIDQKENHTGLTVQDTEVRGDGKDPLSDAINNDGGMITVERVDLSGMDKGVETATGLIADSFIHDPGPDQDRSSNAIQAGPVAVNLTIRHNTLLNSYPSTSAVLMGNGNTPDPVHDVTVTGNYLAGGAYSLYGGVTDAYPHGSYDIVIQNNVFSRRYFAHGGYYAPDAAFDPSGRGNVWSGNTWEGNQGAVLPS